MIGMEMMKRYRGKPAVLGGNLQEELADRTWSHKLWVTLREMGGTALL